MKEREGNGGFPEPAKEGKTQMGYIAGIGGANMDIHGKSERQLVMRDSNPGTLHMSLGGVCRNIC